MNAFPAIIYADAQGRIRFWNQAATRIFGFSEAEGLGESLDLIIPERLRARHWQGYEHVMQGGESRYGAGDLLAVPARRDVAKAPLAVWRVVSRETCVHQ